MDRLKLYVSRIYVCSLLGFVISVLDYIEDGDFNVKGLFLYILMVFIIDSILILIDFCRGKKKARKAPEKNRGYTQSGNVYCAISGNLISGEYFKIKRKHVLNTSSSIHYDGLFKTKAYRVKTVSYLWDVYSVCPKEYKKLERRNFLFLHFFLFWIVIFCYVFNMYIDIEGIWGLIGTIFLSLAIPGLFMPIFEYFYKPKLLEKGIISTMVRESEVMEIEEF